MKIMMKRYRSAEDAEVHGGVRRETSGRPASEKRRMNEVGGDFGGFDSAPPPSGGGTNGAVTQMLDLDFDSPKTGQLAASLAPQLPLNSLRLLCSFFSAPLWVTKAESTAGCAEYSWSVGRSGAAQLALLHVGIF